MDKRKEGPKHDQVLRTTKQNTNTDIISLELEESKIKDMVNKELGYELDPARYTRANEYARHKLKWQSEQLKKKFNSKYTAKVIAETYEQQATMDYVNIVSLGRYEQ